MEKDRGTINVYLPEGYPHEQAVELCIALREAGFKSLPYSNTANNLLFEFESAEKMPMAVLGGDTLDELVDTIREVWEKTKGKLPLYVLTDEDPIFLPEMKGVVSYDCLDLDPEELVEGVEWALEDFNELEPDKEPQQDIRPPQVPVREEAVDQKKEEERRRRGSVRVMVYTEDYTIYSDERMAEAIAQVSGCVTEHSDSYNDVARRLQEAAPHIDILVVHAHRMEKAKQAVEYILRVDLPQGRKLPPILAVYENMDSGNTYEKTTEYKAFAKRKVCDFFWNSMEGLAGARVAVMANKLLADQEKK